MTTWFKANGWSYTPKITPLEVVKETEKFITYTYLAYCGTRAESRIAKMTADEACFPTWGEAHAFLLVAVQARVVSDRRQLELSNAALGNVKGMKAPEENP